MGKKSLSTRTKHTKSKVLVGSKKVKENYYYYSNKDTGENLLFNANRKSARRLSPLAQRFYKNRERAENKRKLDRKHLSKENKKLLTHVKRYKAAVAAKYNKDLDKIMRDKGYFE